MSGQGVPRVYSGEIKMVREALSLTTLAMSQLLGVSEGTIKNWEKGKYQPPPGVEREIAGLEAWTRRCVDAVVAAAQDADGQPMVVVWRLTNDMPPGPARTLGAGWWRSVAARARERVPGLVVAYPDELDKITGSRDMTLSRAVSPDVLPLPR
ncbi:MULTISPECIES: helix-turn-helix domain-containing protein [unclassified Actinomyces]|uniref:helix-turn-helix domain-containing protein n=1 Tax=unclassified Actinomyces TaxID=2609248 RepID=UPI002016AE2E|nr:MULTISPECIES: helix-turn-helix domain-containing protein [unclassified Actinomyces]MCL3776794.1 hypothetical protein [Actinomyces sp. AC-20-1]MCL3789888.1 hypothetical protein [Actinomyces sp. 187325]MCL3792225.1 hypothetical protein [Actinomyces sp. 186855]MCL3794787.1 hypothetical protein [Actinomyces sp. 217892]